MKYKFLFIFKYNINIKFFSNIYMNPLYIELYIKPVIIAIMLNILLSMILSPLASKKEIKPQNGAAELSYKEQFMHMMVHHNQVLFMSSVIVGIVVLLTLLINDNI